MVGQVPVTKGCESQVMAKFPTQRRAGSRTSLAATVDGPSLTQSREPFFGWPGWQHLRCFAWLGVAQTIWFGLVFVGCDRLTAMHSFRVRVHFEAELKLPFVAEMVLFYMSIYLLFCGAPFVLRTRRQLRALTVTLAAVTFCAGICFLLLPAELAFPPPRDVGRWPQLFHFADWLNLSTTWFLPYMSR